MPRNERKKIINEIEKIRGSKLITYFTADRPNLPPSAIADDAVRIIYNHLEKMDSTKFIDLFIYTRGGAMMASFRIARLLREYCEKLGTLVPYRCHSGGTQIALAANEIVMTKLGELSPVDPSTGNAFNAVDRTGQPIPISVEDVRSYLKLSQEKGELVSEEAKLEVFKTLTSSAGVQTHPLALGNVNRVHDEVRLLVEQLLSTHMDPITDSEKIEKIKKQLTEVYTHSYAITRAEAIKIGLQVTKADEQLESLLMKLFDDYAEDAKINEPFFVEDVLNGEDEKNITEKLAFIETNKSGSVYQADIEIKRPKNSQSEAPPLNILPPNLQPPGGFPMPPPIPQPKQKPRIKFKRAKWIDVD